MSSTTNDTLFNLNTAKSLFSGALAGAISRTATSPLERLKMIQQVSSANTSGYSSMSGALRKIYFEEGFLAYWKGNGANVARVAPHSAITFFAFDTFKRWFNGKREKVSTPALLLAGACAGMTASFITFPLDLVNARLCVQTTKKEYNGIGHALSVIWRTEGIRGLYRGIGATLLGIAPYISINFTTFDILKRHFLPSRDSPYFDLINLCCGAVAGGTAATITYPSDVIRRRLQLQGFAGIDVPKCISFFN